MSKDQALPNNSSIINLLEVVTKGFAIVAGALFVVGLLISNIQMMNLGIADLSPLHARNVLVGFLFILYFKLSCTYTITNFWFRWFMVEETPSIRQKEQKSYFSYYSFAVRY
jgi:hypothetical protein